MPHFTAHLPWKHFQLTRSTLYTKVHPDKICMAIDTRRSYDAKPCPSSLVLCIVMGIPILQPWLKRSGCILEYRPMLNETIMFV